MLLAEINGKHDLSVRGHEDYLTSTVFGHLRYVAPGPFWAELFSRAKTLPISGTEQSLTDVLGIAHDIAAYDELAVHFWPKCPEYGEPEMAMVFTGETQPPLVVLVEVKLWAGKSGEGEHDQLKRYLKIAEEVHKLQAPVPANGSAVVVYLTPRESMVEVAASLKQAGDRDEDRRRLFRLQWQDMIEVINQVLSQEPTSSQTILKDVRDFLRVRRLEYFRGFRPTAEIHSLRSGCGAFYTHHGRFHGFRSEPNWNSLSVVKGRW